MNGISKVRLSISLKHLLRNVFVFVVSTCGIAWMYRRWLRKQGPLVRVVVFHDVDDAVWFDKTINMLSRSCHIITPEDFHRRTFQKNALNVLLTFDDGYQTWVDNVLPILRKRNFKGVFFINSGLVNVAHDDKQVNCFMQKQLLISPKKAILWQGVRAIFNEGHTIGGHTVSHPNLATLGEECLTNEINIDRDNISHKLGVKPSDFAYPFGTKSHFNANVSDMVEAAGYRYIYEAEPGFVSGERFYRNVPRMCIEKQQPLRQIKLWVKGGYDIYSYFKNIYLKSTSVFGRNSISSRQTF